MHGDQKSKGKIVIPIWCNAIWVAAFCSGLSVVALPAYSWSIPFIILAAFLGVFSTFFEIGRSEWHRVFQTGMSGVSAFCGGWRRGMCLSVQQRNSCMSLYLACSALEATSLHLTGTDISVWVVEVSLVPWLFGPGFWFIATLLTNPLIIETSKNPLTLWLKIAKRWVMLIPAPACFFTLKSSLFSVCLVYTAWSLLRISHRCCSRLVLTMAGSGHG